MPYKHGKHVVDMDSLHTNSQQLVLPLLLLLLLLLQHV
jgi:hypothetical protein